MVQYSLDVLGEPPTLMQLHTVYRTLISLREQLVKVHLLQPCSATAPTLLICIWGLVRNAQCNVIILCDGPRQQ